MPPCFPESSAFVIDRASWCIGECLQCISVSLLRNRLGLGLIGLGLGFYPSSSIVCPTLLLQVIPHDDALRARHAKSRIWNESWLSAFFHKPCNHELFVLQSLNMESEWPADPLLRSTCRSERSLYRACATRAIRSFARLPLHGRHWIHSWLSGMSLERACMPG